MRVALICEKPSLAKYVINELVFIEPEMDHSSFVVGWASEFWHLNSSFIIPRGQSYQNFPMVREAEYRPVTFDARYFDSETRIPMRRGISARANMNYDSVIDTEDFTTSVKRADVVYVVFDSGSSAYHAQMRVLEWLKSLDGNFVIKHFPVKSVVSEALHHGLINAHEIKDLATHAHLSLVRRHFDYNYLLNAYPIMGMTFERAFGTRLGWPLSKHELQVLYFMRHGRPITDGDLFNAMQKWKGTGRYKTKALHFYNGIGSSASRYGIMETLKKMGFLDRKGKNSLVISPIGERLLQYLHPDCEDPDQVLRIYSWSLLPLDVAKEKVDRYIKTFFGKQKRFLSKMSQGSKMELNDV